MLIPPQSKSKILWSKAAGIISSFLSIFPWTAIFFNSVLKWIASYVILIPYSSINFSPLIYIYVFKIFLSRLLVNNSTISF